MADEHPIVQRSQQCNCVVIGGGPAGLTCGLYFARFNCNTLVIFRDDQRARLIPRTWNFPGHPEGLPGEELIERCKEHARKYGAQLIHGEVESVTGEMGDFHVRLEDGRQFPACHIVFATGVEDVHPNIPRVHKYIGRGLRHCPICDGCEANGRRLAIVGTGDRVARHALYLTTFTEEITILLNGEGALDEIAPELRQGLHDHQIQVLTGRIVEVRDEGAEICGFCLEDGTEVEVDRAYSALPVRPRSQVARRMGIEVDECGFIRVDERGRTNIRGVYAVGDVVNQDYAQVIIGMGQAAVAAIDAHNRYLSVG